MSVTIDKTKYKEYEEIDWESMRWDFENSKCNLEFLSKKYGTYKMQISREWKKREWVKYDPVRNALEKYNSKKAVINPGGILDTVAVRKIQEIVDELGDNYSPVDEPLVVMYAKNYQRYLKLEMVVDEEGEICISPKTGGTYMNPNFSALQAVISNMSKLGDKLGLSISSRNRMNMSLDKKEKTQSLFDLIEEISSVDDIDV